MNNLWILIGAVVLAVLDKKLRNWKEKRHLEKLAEKLFVASHDLRQSDMTASLCFKAASEFMVIRDVQRIMNRGAWIDRRLAWFERQVVRFNDWLKKEPQPQPGKFTPEKPLDTGDPPYKVRDEISWPPPPPKSVSRGKWFQRCANCLNPFYSLKGPESLCSYCKEPPPPKPSEGPRIPFEIVPGPPPPPRQNK